MAYTVYLIHDGTAKTLGTLSGTSRQVETFEANVPTKEFSVRIQGADEEWLDVYEISVDIDMREEEAQ
jgi:hypothetical protein